MPSRQPEPFETTATVRDEVARLPLLAPVTPAPLPAPDPSSGSRPTSLGDPR
ncbi:MAG TPA: hypothetical protein VFN57_13250 [Thermomicrobiaceae bacterium]|nr:hypothetical protein [Thermomicrobiaceae bacterium]